MNIEKQEILSLRHFFQLRPVSCIVVSGGIDSFFTAKTLEPFKMSKCMLKGDPLIIGALQSNNDIEITGGRVIAINDSEGHILVSPDKIYYDVERRENERYPVSLAASVSCHETDEKHADGFVKDMSYAGFCIYSDAELKVGYNIEVDIFLHNSIFSIGGTIIRKSVSYGRNEYGVQSVYKDRNAIYATRDFLDKLMVNEKEVIKKHLLKDFRICV
ncbi:MAG TPA: PilZ domain-containing protein [Clostridia bacterium]|nr:PilZ domain-containing protein [Clostridia bacterium]